MKSKRLEFVVKADSDISAMRTVDARYRLNGHLALNSTEWRGKEPRSCAVTGLKGREHRVGDPSPMLIDIEVSYRPKGYISYTGHTRYDGWTPMLLDRRNDGVLLDGNGQPLEDGVKPMYLPKDVYADIEFNDLDFGDFVGEFDIEDIKHVTSDAVMAEVKASGTFITSTRGSFIAAHRHRPLTKLILSRKPSGEFIDGFGTHIRNIDLSTPHFDHVLMEEISSLMCGFMEGKVSIENTGNNDVTFVELSKSLVDCEPNEDGSDSWFDMLHYYTPIGFMDDLAKRLMAVYAVDIEVVDAADCGLVLRNPGTNT